MYPQIGKDYRLTVPIDQLDEPITWARASQSPYKFWRDVSGKVVRVRSSTRILTNYFLVNLIDLPAEKFYIPKGYLEEIIVPNLVKCTCHIWTLMNRGCQCGAFEKENG